MSLLTRKSNILKNMKSKQMTLRKPWGSIALFLGPAVIMYCFFTLFPVFMTFFNSFHKLDMANNLARSFVGLDNYVELLTKDLILDDALRNSITLAFVTPFFDVGLGFILALILFSKPPMARLFRTLWFVPILVSWVVIGVLTRWIYNYDWGPIVLTLRAIGLEKLAVNFLGTVIRLEPGSWQRYLPLALLIPAGWLLRSAFRSRKGTHFIGSFLLVGIGIIAALFPSNVVNIPLYSLLAMIVWKFAGFSMVIFLAALSSLPEELLDAARIDGANYWQLLRYIIVPLLRVVIVNLFILSWIGKMVQFALVWVTTRGGPVHYTETIATYVQKRAFEWRTLDLGYPSALAVLWFLVVFIGALVLNRLLQAEEILEY
jgi:ABC-type sugar transport system permease subunit